VRGVYLSALILLCSFQAYAVRGDFTCPETHPEYSKVLSELESFKETLQQNLDCQEVSVNFDKITDLLSPKNRKEIFGLANSTNGKPLSADSAKKIQDFAGSVTSEIATAISLIGTEGFMFFAGTNKCNLSEKDEFQAIERLTKAAYVATNLVSKVAGPYGVPLQIGASAFYGVVQGLQSYSKRKRNIDFDKFEKREFYEGAVCLMSKFDSDIRKLNNPEAHLRHLKRARSEALRVVNTLKKRNSSMTLVKEREKASEENLEWIENEIARFSEIAEFKTGGIGPRELQSLKNTINKFLHSTATPAFIEWYSQKARQSLQDTVYKTGETLNFLRRDLQESGLPFDRSLPELLVEQYSKDVYPYGAPYGVVQSHVQAAPAISNLYFLKNNQESVSGDVYGFNSLLGEVYDTWKLSDLNLRVVQEYCEFFQSSLQYSRAVKKSCEKRDLVWTALRTSYQAFYLADLMNENRDLVVLGPFDFRLEKHAAHIDFYTKLSKEPLVLAAAGLDVDDVLKIDKRVRLRDGRLNAANENSPPSFANRDPWWFDIGRNADAFIYQSQRSDLSDN